MQTIQRDYSASGFVSLPKPLPGSVGDIIAKAMAYLDQHGWCQFVARNNNGEACGHGSLNEATSKDYYQMPDYIDVEMPIDFSALLKSMGDVNIVPEVPTRQTIPNPEKKLLYAAVSEAHGFLMDAARKAGWKSEGGLSNFSGKPFKDAFAVFNDDPNTTVEDVKLMMKSAIDLATEAGM